MATKTAAPPDTRRSVDLAARAQAIDAALRADTERLDAIGAELASAESGAIVDVEPLLAERRELQNRIADRRKALQLARDAADAAQAEATDERHAAELVPAADTIRKAGAALVEQLATFRQYVTELLEAEAAYAATVRRQRAESGRTLSRPPAEHYSGITRGLRTVLMLLMKPIGQ